MKKFILIVVFFLIMCFFSCQKCGSDKKEILSDVDNGCNLNKNGRTPPSFIIPGFVDSDFNSNGNDGTLSSVVVSGSVDSDFKVNMNDTFTVIYRRPVNGYRVKAVVRLNVYLSADITFEKNGKSFTLHTESFGDTNYNKGCWGELGDNDSILLKYRNKTIIADYQEGLKDRRSESPMLYDTPFFFRDLDFDGIDELVIVHYTYAVRFHSGFDVYRIVDNTPFFIDYPPYNIEVNEDYFGMTDYPEFDYKKKSISCPYPEGDIKYIGCIVYGVSKTQKDTIEVNGKKYYFNHIEMIGEEKYNHDE